MRLFLSVLFLAIASVGWSWDSGWDFGGIQADKIKADTTSFDNNLSSTDDTVQKALDKLDDVAGTGGAGSGTVSVGNPGYLAVYTGSTTVDDTSVIYTNGTNVGIGTSSPNALLYVNGTTTVNGTINASRFTPNSSTPSGNTIFLPATNTLGFSTNGTEKARIDANGNVGIGTTGPTAAVDVLKSFPSGTLPSYPSGIRTNVYFNSDTTQSDDYYGNFISANTAGAGSFSSTLRGLGGYAYHGATGTLQNLHALEFVAGITGTGNVGSMSLLYPQVFSPGSGTIGSLYGLRIGNLTQGTNNFSIHVGSAKSYFGGNLGIGTTTPASSIHTANKVVDLAGAATVASVMRSTNSAQENSTATSGAGVNISTAGHATATNNIISFSTEETNSQYTPTERMRITSAGNVGIGTSSPSSFIYAVSPTVTKLTLKAGASQSTNYLIDFLNSSGTSMSRIDSAGAFIGRVQNSTATLSFSDPGSYWGPGMAFASNAGIAWGNTSNDYGSTKDIGVTRGSAGKLYIGNGTLYDSSGTLVARSIGVNSTSPSSTLDVIGTFHVSGVSTFDGNVGIGTSSPTHKVEILKTTAPSADILDPTLLVTHSYALSGAQVPTAIKGVYYNPGSGVTTTGHSVGVTGFTYDTAVGVADQFAIEGRANGFGGANYYGGTFRSQWADPVVGNSTVRGYEKMIVGISTKAGIYDYDQSTLRNDDGLLVGAYFGANDGGLFNYGAIFESQTSGFINTTAAFRASTQMTVHVGSDADHTTANAGITFGASGDTNLYRGGANLIKSDDTIQAAGFRSSDGTEGGTGTIKVRNAAGTGSCTITVKNGLMTATTCP